MSKVLSGLREDAPGADVDEEEENREGDALFDEALRVRRRMRVKTSDPARMDDGGGDKVAERIRLLRHIIVEEERMLEDEKETAEMTFRMVRKLREEEENLKQTVPDQTEAEKILHTKMVSPNGVISDKEGWAASIKTELDSLMTEKQALRRVPPRGREADQREGQHGTCQGNLQCESREFETEDQIGGLREPCGEGHGGGR